MKLNTFSHFLSAMVAVAYATDLSAADAPTPTADESTLKPISASWLPVFNGTNLKWLDGVKTVDLVDEKGPLSSSIGFQLCHGAGRVTDASFKNVVYRPLKSDPAK